jgi:hypothetical protein
VLVHIRTTAYKNVGKGGGATSGSVSFVSFNTFKNNNPISCYPIKITYSQCCIYIYVCVCVIKYALYSVILSTRTLNMFRNSTYNK